ncbi:hypothetical protein A4X09_0g4588 [Tilletia walkeri]|uniref:pH-response regulator protein palC n=1 Tax=Tilletia walkeri TaxID=117179 RepID=A0A8X7N852_9BASI|nr:hypothetical protein A4X09_0g4588 [Tilletia walkeri]
MYLHELPTTGEIVFSDFLLASSSYLTSQLAHATELRARIRSLLKANRKDDATTHSSRDWMKIIKATEEYLPLLFAIHNCLQTDDLILKYEPEFSWRTTFSASIIGPPPRIALRGIHYELTSVLLLSATALSNLATSLITALGSYERDRTLSEQDRKSKDDRLKTAADLLCRASGIFEYLGTTLIPAWENAVGRIDPRPPETTPELASALSKLALADAQTLAIRKLLSPSVALAEDTITPGPPLPRGHPSPSLLAKLHLESCALYESAEQLARLAGSKRAGGGSYSGAIGGAGGGGVGTGMGLGASASGRVGGSGGRRAVEPASSPLGNSKLGGGGGGGGGVGAPDTMPRGGGIGGPDMSDDGSSSHGPVAGAGHPYSPGGSKPSRLLHFASRLGGNNQARPGPSPAAASDSPPPSSGGSSSYSHPGITSSLLNYLSTNALFARAQAYRWLGVDTGEQRSAYGEALAYLALARDELEDGDSSSTSNPNGSNNKQKGKLARKLADLSSSSSSSNRNKELRTALKAQSNLELRDIAHWTTSYTKINNTITFYPIPPPTDMLSKIPAGRAALALKVYTPPTPAFGPGALGGFLSDGMRRLGFGHAEDDDDEVEVEGGGPVEHDGNAPPEGSLLGTERKPKDAAKYAGAGAYY